VFVPSVAKLTTNPPTINEDKGIQIKNQGQNCLYQGSMSDSSIMRELFFNIKLKKKRNPVNTRLL
jgi:hypothetical protein